MHIHFIAIGGSIMHNLAIALHKKGYQVTGSDDAIVEPAKDRLKTYGLLPPENGWRPADLHEGIDAVILGMHAKPDNPELIKVRELGIRVYSFPEFVGQEIQDKQKMVIAGSHGKTTITSMLMHVLKAGGEPFDYLVGAPVPGFEDSVAFERDTSLAVLEGDEYLSSPLDSKPKFLHYEPEIVLISGIAWDHMNVFPTFESYVQAFRDLLSSMPPNSHVVYFQEDQELVRLVKEFAAIHQLIPYGEPEWALVDNQFIIRHKGHNYSLQLAGKHNLWNLAGAMRMAELVGITPHQCLEAMQSFQGAGKRLEILKETASTIVYRDFAHAPSKVKATIDGLKTQYPEKRLMACLELHTYSSLNQEFLPLYEGTLNQADQAWVYVNPHALTQKNMPAIRTEAVKDAFDYPELPVFQNEAAMMETLEDHDPTNAVIVFMSSGNYNGYPLKAMVERWVGQ